MAKSRKESWKMVRVTEETLEKLKYCADLLEKSHGEVIGEYIHEIWEIMANLRKPVNISYESSFLGQTIEVSLSGRSTMKFGVFPMPTIASKEEVDEKIRQNLGEEN